MDPSSPAFRPTLDLPGGPPTLHSKLRQPSDNTAAPSRTSWSLTSGSSAPNRAAKPQQPRTTVAPTTSPTKGQTATLQHLVYDAYPCNKENATFRAPTGGYNQQPWIPPARRLGQPSTFPGGPLPYTPSCASPTHLALHHESTGRCTNPCGLATHRPS